MVSFLSSWVTTGDTGTTGYMPASSLFSRTTRQLDAWILDMSRGGPEPKTMWFSSLWLFACEAGRAQVKAQVKA